MRLPPQAGAQAHIPVALRCVVELCCIVLELVASQHAQEGAKLAPVACVAAALARLKKAMLSQPESTAALRSLLLPAAPALAPQ